MYEQIILDKPSDDVLTVLTLNQEAIVEHKLKKIRAGALYSVSLYEYRGFTVRGMRPRHGWGGSSWSWYAERGEVKLNAFSRKAIVEKINRLMSAA
jgi:hypothetical protein